MTTQDTAPATRRDDLAYIAPMAAYLVFLWLGQQLPGFFTASYALRTVLVAGLIVYFWRHYTPVHWTHLGLGVLIGVVGVVQWVGMEKLLKLLFETAAAHHVSLGWVPGYGAYTRPPDPDAVFDPFARIATPAARYAFIAVRLIGASIVVPVMEELFWRDYLWRTVYAPNDFKMARVGDWDAKTVVIVALLFSTVHIQWLTAIVWGLLIAWLLVRTRSLGACIVAHAVTNFLLGIYVLIYRDWALW